MITDLRSREDRASAVPREDLLPRGRFPLKDWPPSDGTLAVIEPPRLRDLRPPEFVCNLSNANISSWVQPRTHIHGSYLVARSDVTLFGPNHLVSRSGLWSCETRNFKRQYMALVVEAGFCKMHPGVKPQIELAGDLIFLDYDQLHPCHIHTVHEPVFLATPLEPDNWGRWLATTVPKSVQFKAYGQGRKFFCRAAHLWQRNLLRLLGIEDLDLREHDPGKTYFCHDVATIEYSVTDMSVSDTEKQIYADLAQACQRITGDTHGERIFVSRLSYSARHPHHRVLQNEPELIAALAGLGFKAVQPEQLSIAEQIGLFARARCVVALGGAALFSVRFSPPGTTVVTIESSDYFIRGHCMQLSSLGHRFGVIFGQQDLSDPTRVHKRWSIDVQRACAAIQGIL